MSLPLHRKLDLWPFFLKHPLRGTKAPEAMCGSRLDRPKVVCRRCFHTLVQEEKNTQTTEKNEKKRIEVQSEDEIATSLWNGPANLDNGSLVWMQGRVENISRHLKDCPKASQSEKELGLSECVRLDLVKTPASSAGVRRTYDEFASDLSTHYPTSTANTSNSTTASSSPSPLITNFNSLHFFPSGSRQNSPGPSNPDYSISPTVGATSSLTVGTSSPTIRASSPTIASSLPVSKRMRTTSGLSRVASFSRGPEPWTQDEKNEFCRSIARITASCGFPFLWVENPVWRKFCDNYLPQAPRISRNTLANRWIPEEVTRYRQHAMEQSRGSLVTIQFDGWTGSNSRYYVGFMAGTDKRQMHPVFVHDGSNEQKTATNLYNVIKLVREDLETKWEVEVIAMCSDAAGESLKARSRGLSRFNDSKLFCSSAGDYFRAAKTSPLMSFSNQANDLIVYLRSRTQVLAKIRQIQEEDQEHSTIKNRILLPIRPVITRWTAHYAAYDRLLQLRWVLEAMVRKESDQPLLLVGTSKVKEKAREMIRIINNANFWYNVLKMKKNLEPLARASCILQAAHTRLDEVAIIFGTLYKEYLELLDEEEDEDGRQLIQAILDSLDKRWKNSDQDICIAAVFCNPFYKTLPFVRSHHLSVAAIWALLRRLWIRFFKSNPSAGLFLEIQEYISGTGRYQYLPGLIAAYRENLVNSPIDPLQVYANDLGGGSFLLPRIARRLLSVVANSASCERLFSMFGITLSRLRSRLRESAMTNLATLRMYLREEHIRYNLVKERLQRDLTSHSHAPFQPTEAREQPSHAENQAEDTQLDSDSETEATRQFSAIADTLAHAAEAIDEEDNSELGSSIKLALPEVFEFRDSYWTDIWRGLAMRNLADEIEFHELVDLDGNAEVDDGTEVDITLALA